jgi:serine protease DegS
MRMSTPRKTFLFLLHSIAYGLAAAFVLVWLQPGLLQPGRPGVDNASETYAAAVQRSAPAVVNIHSARRVADRNLGLGERGFSERFGEEFGPRNHIETTLGSGVLVENGYILTNHHVINDAQAIQVALADGRIVDAEVIGTDPDTDIALLAAEIDGAPSIPLGRSDRLQVGDVVLAIGNPFGVGQTVTQGIVSATGRNSLGLSTFENFIQTDAAINPGNSGGALINSRGELVGISTAIFSSNGGSNGIGFAVPVNLARGVMQQLLEHGRVIRGWLGVDPQDLTPELAEAFGLPDTRGVIVRDVYRNSPADAAGLQRGDTITHINGKTIANAREALTVIAGSLPGETLNLQGVRNGTTFVAKATIIERSPPPVTG